MYEREAAGQVQGADYAAKISAATRAGYINGSSLADAPEARPAGVLKCHAMRLREALNQIEGQRNRIYSLTERLLSPRPVPGEASNKQAERVHHDTIEGDMEQLIQQADRLHSSLGQIADRLDGAV